MPLLVAGLAIPTQPGAHLPRRPAGRDEHLRAQHRDDARARPGDRLLAVHRQPVPRGAAPRPDRRRGRRAGRVAPAGKAIAFSGIAVAIGLSGLLLFEAPAIRSIGIAGAIVVLCSVVFALTFLPAVLGMLGHRVNALSLERPRATASGRSPTASSRPATSRWERVAHCGHAPPDRGARPDPRLPARRRHARSCASSRACPAPRSTRPASRAAMRTSRCRPSSAPAKQRRSSSSPTSRAPRPISANVKALDALHRRARGARGDRPGRGPVQHGRSGNRRRDDARAGRPLSPRPRGQLPPDGRRRPRPPRGDVHPRLRRSGSTRSARSMPSQPKATRSDPGRPGA